MRKYIRHHTGVIHDVPAATFYTHLTQARAVKYDDQTIEPAREATLEEIAAMWRAQGLVYVPETDEALTSAEHAARQAVAAPLAPSDETAEPADKPAKGK